MKRILCTLSITLLLSFPYTVEAGKKKNKGNKHAPVGTVVKTLNESDDDTVATQSPNSALLLKQSLTRLKDLQERRKNLDEAIAQEQEARAEILTDLGKSDYQKKLARVLPQIRAGINSKEATPEVLEDDWVAPPDDATKEAPSGGWFGWASWGSSEK